MHICQSEDGSVRTAYVQRLTLFVHITGTPVPVMCTSTVFKLLGVGGPNCFLNPLNCHIMFWGSAIYYSLHHYFGRAPTVEKFNPPAIFSQFKHCISSTDMISVDILTFASFTLVSTLTIRTSPRGRRVWKQLPTLNIWLLKTVKRSLIFFLSNNFHGKKCKI